MALKMRTTLIETLRADGSAYICKNRESAYTKKMQRRKEMSELAIVRKSHCTACLIFNSNTTTVKKLGRGIPKIISLFGDIRDIIDDADQHGLHLEGGLDDTKLESLDEAEAVIIKQW